jgi:hypothetical protein
MTNVGQNMWCDAEEILTFETFTGFKKEVACEMANG